MDFGRPAARSLGVPVGGAADRLSLVLGNALVGNPPEAAALEISLAGPTLVADADLGCVVHGAPFAISTDRQELTAGTSFTLCAGEVLRIGGTASGMRAYLCVRGGLGVPTVLNSRSALKPLQAGDEIPVEPGRLPRRFLRPPPGKAEHGRLRVLPGPQADWFRLDDFLAAEYVVTPASNRMGLRLGGPPLPFPPREMVSEPVCPGTVQVTRDGRCILLGVDGQTIGGYPKIAQVVSADLDDVGQLRPGERVTFARVTLEEAEALYRQKQALVRRWVTRLRVACE